MQDFIFWAGGLAVSGVFGLIGWIIQLIRSEQKEMRDEMSKTKSIVFEKIDNVEKKLSDHELYASRSYVTTKAMDSLVDRVMEKLDKLDDKITFRFDKFQEALNKKVDK
jgi:hypothetical protein